MWGGGGNGVVGNTSGRLNFGRVGPLRSRGVKCYNFLFDVALFLGCVVNWCNDNTYIIIYPFHPSFFEFGMLGVVGYSY